MKNFKQITFGLLLGALVVGFSAFTSHKSSVRVTKLANGKFISSADYYLKVANAGSLDSDPSHYIFRTTEDAGCQENPSDVCQATWQTDTAPANNDSPSTLGNPQLVGTAAVGDYNGQ